MSDFFDINTRSRLLELKKELHVFVDESNRVVIELNDLAENLDQHFNRICKAKIGGSTAAVVGGILATIGFGLSFVTFGASLGLTIAGGIIAGAGGTTTSVSMITDAVLSRNRRKSAEEIFEKYKDRIDKIKKECVEIGLLLNHHGDIDESFPFWVRFWANLIIGGGAGAKNVAWDIIARTILNSLRIASYADDVLFAGARAGTTAFRIMSPAAQGLHIAGGVFGILLLPVDIYTLVDSSIDVHKSPHRVSEGIRKTGEEIRKDCPTKEEIDIMIEETLKKID